MIESEADINPFLTFRSRHASAISTSDKAQVREVREGAEGGWAAALMDSLEYHWHDATDMAELATRLTAYNTTPVQAAAGGHTSPAESGLPWVAMWTRPEGGFSTPASPATLLSTPLVPAYSPVHVAAPKIVGTYIKQGGF